MPLINPVFIHGWSFSSKVFEPMMGLKVELPAHGESKLPYKGMERLVETIALRLPSKHDVVGWSMGGSLAMLMAVRFPSKVNRLFLIGSSPFFGGAWSEKNIRAFKLMIKRDGVLAFRRRAFPKIFEDSIEVSLAMTILEDYINTDLRPLLPYIRHKVYILHGAEDNVCPVNEAFKLHSLIKGSKLIILPGGHFPAEDEKSLLSTLLKVSRDL